MKSKILTMNHLLVVIVLATLFYNVAYSHDLGYLNISKNSIVYQTPNPIHDSDIAVAGIQINSIFSNNTYSENTKTYNDNVNNLGGDIQFFIPVSNSRNYLGVGLYSLSMNNIDGEGYNSTIIPIMFEYRKYFYNNFFIQVGVGYGVTLTQSQTYHTNSGITAMGGIGYDFGKFEILETYYMGTMYYNNNKLNGQINLNGAITELNYKF